MPRVNYNDPDVEDFYDDLRYGITVSLIGTPYLYERPDYSSTPMSIVHSDIEVDILDEIEDWYKIRFPKTFGVIGFVPKIYVEEVP